MRTNYILINLIISFFLIQTATLKAQDIFQDNFDRVLLNPDQNNPIWEVGTNNGAINGDFIINANQLQSDFDGGAGGRRVYFSTQLNQEISLAEINVEWEFEVQINFPEGDFSGDNQVRVYLASNSSDLVEDLNGYFLQIGDTDDPTEIQLRRQSGSSTTQIDLNGGENINFVGGEPYTYNVRANRRTNGNWSVFVNGLFLGEGIDDTHTTFSHFGAQCRFTSNARGDKFSFDNIAIYDEIEDRLPPELDQIEVLNDTEVRLSFNEPISLGSANEENNYILDPDNANIHPQVAQRDQTTYNQVVLTFANPFQEGIENTLRVINIADISVQQNAIPINSPAEINFVWDNTAPIINNPIVVNNNKQLTINFSEELDPVTSSNPRNYTLNNGVGSPALATRTGAGNDQIILNFSEILESENYILTVNRVEDIAGNATNQLQSEEFEINNNNFAARVIQAYATSPFGINVEFDKPIDPDTIEPGNPANYSVEDEGGNDLENPVTQALIADDNPTILQLFFDDQLPEGNRLFLTILGVRGSNGNLVENADNIPFEFDNTNPTVESDANGGVVAINSNVLKVTFREDVEQTSAQTTTNYEVDGIGNPSTAVRDPNQIHIVYLTFDQDFEQERLYEISISDIIDLSQNQAGTTTREFIYDTRAPSIIESKITAPDAIQITFSEELDAGSSQIPANYAFRDADNPNAEIVTPITAQLLNSYPRVVTLTFATSFSDQQIGDNILVSVANVEDLRGNAIVPAVTFQFEKNKPKLSTANVISNTQIELLFSELIALDEADPSRQLNNYTLNNNIHPTEIAFEQGNFENNNNQPAKITLTFANAFAINQQLTLMIDEISPLAGGVSLENQEVTVEYDPQVERIVVVGDASLAVHFEENLIEEIAEDNDRYQLDDGGNQLNAARLDQENPNIVYLIFQDNIESNVNHQLRVGPLTKVDLKIIPASTQSFLIDRQPARISRVELTDNNEIAITFNEEVQEESAENLLNYEIRDDEGNDTALADATLDNTDRVLTLEAEDDFGFGIEYTVFVRNVLDLDGNAIEEEEENFSQPLPPREGEIVITELMIDPDPAVNLPNTEYIELYNNSNKNYNIRGMYIRVGASQTTLPDYELNAGSYVVLCPNDNANLFEVNNVLGITPWRTLPNTGKEIALVAPDEEVIHSLTYLDDWYQNADKNDGGWTLEIVNPNNLCGEEDNWRASENENGGTPGVRNSVFNNAADNTNPEIASVDINSLTELSIAFSEKVTGDLEAVANYSISGGIRVQSIEVISNKSFTLTLNAAIQRGTSYTITARNLRDCSNNAVSNNAYPFGVGEFPEVNDLLITEIYFDPADESNLPDAEYIEVYNRTNKFLSLEGLKVADGTGFGTVQSGSLRGGEYAVLTSTSKIDLFEDVNVFGVTSFPSLNNTGEQISLIREDEEEEIVINSIDYSPEWYRDAEKEEGGWSLEIIDPNNFCAEDQNWKASESEDNGTPGLENSVNGQIEDNQSPKVSYIQLIDNQNLKIQFDEKITQETLGQANNYDLSNNLQIDEITIENNYTIQLKFTAPLNASQLYQISFSDLTDCFGNNIDENASFEFGIGEMPVANELIISEIYADFNPTVSLPEAEYVEIYNRTNKLISLKDVGITDGSRTGGLEGGYLKPNAYLVLTGTTKVDLFDIDNVIGVPNFPTLNDSGEKISLIGLDETIIHEVDYATSWYNDSEKDNGGWSLEIIDPNNFCAEENNWSASENEAGGTPGVVNSINGVNADEEKPTLTEVEIVGEDQLRLVFSEKMDLESLNNRDNYQISDGLSVTEVQIEDEKNVIITLNQNLISGTLYSIQVNNVTDCPGNTIEENETSFGTGSIAQPGELVITEIMADINPPLGLPEVEYVEIFNTTDKLISLEGLILADATSQTELRPGFISGNTYMLLVATGNLDSFEGINIAGVPSFPTLNDGSETISIINQSGELLHRVSYTSAWYRDSEKDNGGWSLEMIDPNNLCGEEDNWRASIDERGGTPGEQNSVFADNPDEESPSLSTVEIVAENQLQVTFSEKMDEGSISQTENYVFTNNVEVIGFAIEDNKTVLLTLSSDLLRTELYALTVENVTDCAGNAIGENNTFTFGIGEKPSEGELIFTEVYADVNPPVGLPEAEYLEVYNRSEKLLSLKEIFIEEEDLDRSGSLGENLLQPGEYAVLTGTSRVELFGEGIKVIGVSGIPSLTDGGKYLALVDEQGNKINSISYSNSWYGDSEKGNGGWSLEMIDPNNLCGEKDNWRASIDEQGGTPGEQNSVFANNPDEESPSLSKVEIVADNQLRVTFSEKMDEASISQTENYVLTNNAEVSGFAIEDNKTVLLNLSSDLLRTELYTLTVENATDCAGNAIGENNTLTFGIGEKPSEGELIFTEVYADVNPPVGLPEAEYLEVYNRSEKLLSLKEIFIEEEDLDRSGSLGDNLLQPGEYAVLTSTTRVELFGEGIKVIGVSGIPSLTDGGKYLALVDEQGNKINSISYSNSWYGDSEKDNGGWSLEMIDPNNLCGEEDNWRASIDERGGTPGAQNSVLADNPDQKTPEIAEVNLVNAETASITFSEKMELATLAETTNYSLDNNAVIQRIEIVNEKEITLYFTELQEGILYALQIQNLEDCSGNVMEVYQTEIARGKIPGFNDLVITEIYTDQDPSSSQAARPRQILDAEFIEIYNRTGEIFDLENMTLQVGDNRAIAFPKKLILPNQYLIVTDEDDLSEFNSPNSVGLSTFYSIGNTFDYFVIRNQSGELVHERSFDNEYYNNSDKNTGGYSIEMIDPNNPCAGRENWKASENEVVGATPGLINSISGTLTDSRPPVLESISVVSTTAIYAVFSETLDSTSVQNAVFEINNSIQIRTIEFNIPTTNTVYIFLDNELQSGVEYTFTVRDVQDCLENTMAETNTAKFYLPQSGGAFDIFISEILFNPRSGGVDFVEIYNASDKHIDLNGWALANSTKNDNGELVVNTVKKMDFGLGATTIAPGQFLAFTPDPTVLKGNYLNAVEENLVKFDLPSYPDSEGSAILLNDREEVADWFDYSEDYHFSLLNNVDGVSLERVSFELPTENPNNWKSAASTVGYATPGLINSQAGENPLDNLSEDCFSVDPPVFSPDIDGTDDYTNLLIGCEAQGKVANITIFDSYGREVRKLAQNQLLSRQDVIQWDGTDTKGEKVRIGYYLIFIEVFDLDGNVDKITKKVVVGTRF